MNSSIWHLYILRLTNDHLYTGITTDIERRIEQHRQGKGAKYLRGKGALQLVFTQELGGHSQALKAEHLVKKLSKEKKEMLVHGELTFKEVLCSGRKA